MSTQTGNSLRGQGTFFLATCELKTWLLMLHTVLAVAQETSWSSFSQKVIGSIPGFSHVKVSCESCITNIRILAGSRVGHLAHLSFCIFPVLVFSYWIFLGTFGPTTLLNRLFKASFYNLLKSNKVTVVMKLY